MSRSSNIKKERYESLIKEIITDAITKEVYEPLIKLASIHYVNLSADKSIAKIYVSHYDKSKIPAILEKMNSASGFFRKKLADSLNLRRAPSVVFLNDDTIDKFDEIEEIIKQFKE